MSDKLKILIIDDSRVDRELSRMILEKNGFQVVELSSAASCLETIAAERPNLLLLDIMMPDFDGNQVLQMIRGQYSEIELPVIMVTSKADAADVVESLKLGANDYITKPIQFDVALRRIQTHLKVGIQSNLIAQAKELSGVQAAITTFNHEINNPLTIALGNVQVLKRKYGTEPEFTKLEATLWRIADVVKKSSRLLEETSVKYEAYAVNSKMVSLKPQE